MHTVRVALVLNGGVSLAVWMGGVVKELDIASRASRETEPSVPPEDVEHWKRWKALLDARDLRLEIDIIAGTSAGGLNGALVATSQGAGAPAPSLRRLWSDSADLSIGKLIPPDPAPGMATTRSNPPSVLSGGFFRDQVEKQITAIAESAPRDPVARPETTLFVTSTALGVHLAQFRDSRNQRFDAADHRRVWRFYSPAFRPTEDTDPAAENDFLNKREPLVSAARASASFPVAFEPEMESPELFRCGVTRRDRPSWLMDGGVLDNAPFGPILREMKARPVSSDVKRLLVYVVPSTGATPLAATTDGDPRAPTWVTILSSVLAFRGEVDFRDDTEELGRALTEVEWGQGMARRTFAGLGGTGEASVEAADLTPNAATLYPWYRSSESARSLSGLRRQLAVLCDWPTKIDASPAPGNVPVLPSLPEAPPMTEPVALSFEAAERSLRLMLDELRIRIAVPGEGRQDLADAALAVSTCIARIAQAADELVETARAASAIAPDSPPSDDELWETISGPWTAAMTELDGRVSDAVTSYAGAVGVASTEVWSALAVTEISTQAFAAGARPGPSFELLRIGPDTASDLFPDSFDAGASKLYGSRLGHFGAFGLPRWRNWDWTWGRLDAAAQLARALELPTAVDDLQKQICEDEQSTPDQLADELPRVQAKKNGDLIGEFLAKADGGTTAAHALIDSALRFLAREDDRFPPLLPPFGRTLQTLLRMRSRPDGSRLLRLLGSLLRKRVDSWLEDRERSAALAATSPPE
jgi:predicted acylesterase/phospholipase RssA